jgi:hypothetical protein
MKPLQFPPQIKTRMMNSAGSSGKKYNGVMQALTTIVKEEGASALYKGFAPICARKLVWCATFFVGYENIREAMNK